MDVSDNVSSNVVQVPVPLMAFEENLLLKTSSKMEINIPNEYGIDGEDEQYVVTIDILLAQKYYKIFYTNYLSKMSLEEEDLKIPLFVDLDNSIILDPEDYALYTEGFDSCFMYIEGEKYELVQISKEKVLSMVTENTSLKLTFDLRELNITHENLLKILDFPQLKDLSYLTFAANEKKVLLCCDDNALNINKDQAIEYLELQFI